MQLTLSIICGLVLGSFLSVLIARWPRWKGVVAGRSRCPHDGHTLAWYELVPVISWVLQLGRCRVCGKPISVWYPVYELAMAAVLGGYVFRFGFASAANVLNLIVLVLLVALFFFDVRHMILPDVLVAPLAAIAVVRTVVGQGGLLSGLWAAAWLGAVFGGLYLLSRGRWLGLGDVKLGVALGLLLGFPGAVTVTILAVYAGAATGIGLVLTRRASGETALPFGAFWTAMAVAALLWPATIASIGAILLPL